MSAIFVGIRSMIGEIIQWHVVSGNQSIIERHLLIYIGASYSYCETLDKVKDKIEWLAKLETPGHNVCRIFQSAMCVKLDKDGDVSYYKGNNDNADSLY